MKKRICLFIVTLLVTAMLLPAAAFAESAPLMTAYYQVLKEGNTVYCGGAAGIYKVDLNDSGTIDSKTLLFKSYRPFGKYSYIIDMYKQGEYIYFLQETEGTTAYLKRVSETGTSKKLAALDDSEYGYSIDGDTIYYSTYNWEYDDEDYDGDAGYQLLKRMNLDGSSKQDTTITPNTVSKKSNEIGYSRVIKKKGKYLKDYLKTPNGTFYLGKIKKSR